MALLAQPKTVTRSISKPEILSSTSLGAMKLLSLRYSRRISCHLHLVTQTGEMQNDGIIRSKKPILKKLVIILCYRKMRTKMKCILNASPPLITVFSDTPAIADGSTMAQFFCGQDTLVCDAYGIKSTKQFINTLADNIRNRGAMHPLISDGGSYEISKKVTDLLRSLFIADYLSEPYHQHQNKAENQWGTAKRWVNKIMNSSGCPPSAWLLCLQYICVLLNHMSSPALDSLPPLQALTGQTPDIHSLLQFSFWEPVYYRVNPNEPYSNFPSTSNERKNTGLVSLTMLVSNLPYLQICCQECQ